MTTQNIPSTLIEELNKTYKTDIQFKNENDRFVYYIGKIENSLPHLFKDIEIEIRWSPINQTGWVSYNYTHPNGGQNGYSLGMIIDGKFSS